MFTLTTTASHSDSTTNRRAGCRLRRQKCTQKRTGRVFVSALPGSGRWVVPWYSAGWKTSHGGSDKLG